MAQITGSSVTLADSFANNGSVRLNAPATSATAEINGTTFLYVASSFDDAVQIFSVDSAGALTALGFISDTAGTALDQAFFVTHARSGGNDFLIVAGASDDGITSYALSDTPGYATFADSVFDSEDPALELNAVASLATYETASQTFIYAAGSIDDGISVFSLSAAGTLTNVSNLADDAALNLNGAFVSPTFEYFGSTYLIGSGVFDDGFSLFSLNSSTGALSERASFSDPGGVNGPRYSVGADIDGTMYIYVPSSFAASVSVFRWTGSGEIVPVQTIQSTGVLNGAFYTKLLEIGDTLILAVSTDFSSTVHFYEIDTNGASGTAGELTLIQTVEDGDLGAGLDNARLGQPFEVDGSYFVPAFSLFDDTVNIFEVGGGDDVLEGTQGDDEMTGRGGDDIIFGLAGDDTIDGGNDSDFIYAGSGVDTVYASNGADRTFGGSNFDTFDAGFFNGSSAGVQIDTGFNLFRTPGGFKQFVDGFERLNGTAQDDDLRGDDANNDLRGLGGDDVLNGRGGNDVLRGSNGDDRLLGGDGNDFLFGGFGNDDLRGGSGADNIRGEAGDDFILGGNGADTIEGGSGSDVMQGNGGTDTFVFTDLVLGATEFDAIRDFADGQDLLDLSDFGFANAADALSGATQRAWGVRLQLDADQVLALDGLQLGNLGAADLIL